MTDVTTTPPTTTRQPKRCKTNGQAPVLQEELVGIHRGLFDCQVDLHTGTVVPQTTWTPVFFVLRNGSFGVPYKHLAWRDRLQNATAEVPSMFKRCNLNMRLRIKWPGYKLFYYEFRIYDKKLGQDVPITMSRLVERVARGIHRLYFEAVPDPHEFDERWKLGEDGIQLDDITIVGLLHISKGAWLPILQLTRHVVPRCEIEIDRKKGLIYMCP
ncbi:hypothetical protein BJV78DRAFT_1178819 [Lactifluus subvellereus]|nr:hypothetical protein BJV78DRAFT_1178819 [Lactifluus subvellereus]